MTEKPNSVCKWYCGHCGQPKDNEGGLCSVCSKFPTKFSPTVAEPAEPSASYIGSEEERIFMEKKALGDFATVSAEPAAERPPSDGLHIPSDSDPRAIAAPQPVAHYLKACVKEGPDCDCVNVCKFDAQPAAACTGIVACTQKEACLKVNRCLKNLPQPVAGEGPQPWPMIWGVRGKYGSNSAYFNRESAERFIAERTEPQNYRIIEYIPKPEGTPKLEEIIVTLLKAVNRALPYVEVRQTRTDLEVAARAALDAMEGRPFITPASSPEKEK